MESFFRPAFWVLFISMILLQAFYVLRLRLKGQRQPAHPPTTVREPWIFPAMRGLRATLMLAFLVLYGWNPPWFSPLSMPLQDGFRWLGVILGMLSLALYTCSRHALGKAWSSCLQMQAQHALVTTGPYAWIRHPIYLAMILFLTALTLVGANWVLVAFLIISIVDLVLRIPREEQMMIEVFGEAYEAYKQQTGGIFPRWGKG
ncbi:MAG TPA: isoprenylcysteine carboxylmethyltransferase family protein [Anaerolineae bacterium]|nr:isoprenylcysteine carboxylmethyltransferase family protein [Anaerolineae bacterium]